MKLTNKQALMLFDIAKDTISYMFIIGGYDTNDRRRLVDAILNQQSNELVDLEGISEGCPLEDKE